jgi:hypothetical protein
MFSVDPNPDSRSKGMAEAFKGCGSFGVQLYLEAVYMKNWSPDTQKYIEELEFDGFYGIKDTIKLAHKLNNEEVKKVRMFELPPLLVLKHFVLFRRRNLRSCDIINDVASFCRFVKNM